MQKTMFKFNPMSALALVLAGFAVLFGSAAAEAQATRTWVSGVGDDANPCSRTAPCKTFAGAISKTAIGGEIDVLDPGGFGAVTITKSISIEAVGVIAGVLVSGTNGIIVNTAASDVVVIRGLTIEGLGTGLAGITSIGGGTLHVEGCTINNFSARGIDFTPASTGSLFVKDTIIRNNLGAGSGGIYVRNQAAFASIDNVRLENNNNFGLRVDGTAQATIRNSVVAKNAGPGVAASGGTVYVDRSLVFANGTGLNNLGAGSIRFSDSGVFNNAVGFGGTIETYGNNRIANNGAGTTPVAASPGLS